MPTGETPLEREYYFLEDLISRFNSDCLEIKKWSVTSASAVAVAGQFGGTPPAVQLSIIAALAIAFWVTETLWRVNQWAFIRRVQQMEAVGDVPQVSSSWTRFYLGKVKYDVLKADAAKWWDMAPGETSPGRVLSHFLQLRTSLPHGLITLLAAGLLIANWYGVLPDGRADAGGSIKIELPLRDDAGKRP